MTVLEALDVLKERCPGGDEYDYVLEDSGIVKVDLSNKTGLDSYLDLDWSYIDIHTVDKFHFAGSFLDLDSNRSLDSLDGLIFDGKMIRAYGTGIDPKSLSYIQDIVRRR